MRLGIFLLVWRTFVCSSEIRCHPGEDCWRNRSSDSRGADTGDDGCRQSRRRRQFAVYFQRIDVHMTVYSHAHVHDCAACRNQLTHIYSWNAWNFVIVLAAERVWESQAEDRRADGESDRNGQQPDCAQEQLGQHESRVSARPSALTTNARARYLRCVISQCFAHMVTSRLCVYAHCLFLDSLFS